MRRLAQALAVIGALALAAGVGWAYAERAAALHAGATALLAAGTLAALASVALLVLIERRPGGLLLPEEPPGPLPAPRWDLPVGLTGVWAALGGAYASPPLLVVGLLLLAAAVVGAGRALQAEPRALDRTTVRLARRARDFALRHPTAPPSEGGGVGDAVIEHVGRGVSRLVVVADDGAFGDLVAPDTQRAVLAARLAGLRVHEEFPREVAARVRTGPYEWRRMAGLQLGGGRTHPRRTG